MSEGQQAGLPTHEDEATPWEEMQWRRPWMGAFLKSLSMIANVSTACRVARISRETAYYWRKGDSPFELAWDSAKEEALDNDEREVHRRGRLGWDKTIVRVHVERDSEGLIVKELRVETTVHEVSDSMLLAHLRAHRPERWRESREVRHSGAEGGAIQLDVREVDEVVERFGAEVIRLSDARAARAGVGGDGGS